MRRLIGLAMLAIALAMPVSRAQAAAQSEATAPQIAWREGDVEDAFAEAKEANRPVLLYWGPSGARPAT
jgi:protein disulfide-isomerase